MNNHDDFDMRLEQAGLLRPEAENDVRDDLNRLINLIMDFNVLHKTEDYLKLEKEEQQLIRTLTPLLDQLNVIRNNMKQVPRLNDEELKKFRSTPFHKRLDQRHEKRAAAEQLYNAISRTLWSNLKTGDEFYQLDGHGNITNKFTIGDIQYNSESMVDMQVTNINGVKQFVHFCWDVSVTAQTEYVHGQLIDCFFKLFY